MVASTPLMSFEPNVPTAGRVPLVDGADACRFETAKRWRANVVTGACVESWSPYYSSLTQGPEPKMASCAERNEAKAFMTMCMTSKGYALAERCKDLRIERFGADCYN